MLLGMGWEDHPEVVDKGGGSILGSKLDSRSSEYSSCILAHHSCSVAEIALLHPCATGPQTPGFTEVDVLASLCHGSSEGFC